MLILSHSVHKGKFGQSNTHDHREVISSLQQLIDIQKNPVKVITYFKQVSRENMLIYYSPDPKLQPAFRHGNLLVSAEITAKGRLMLIKAMVKLDKAGWIVAYADTGESVFRGVT